MRLKQVLVVVVPELQAVTFENIGSLEPAVPDSVSPMLLKLFEWQQAVVEDPINVAPAVREALLMEYKSVGKESMPIQDTNTFQGVRVFPTQVPVVEALTIALAGRAALD